MLDGQAQHRRAHQVEGERPGPAVNCKGFTDFQIWVCTFGMALGRLEPMALLVLFTPRFWRR